MWIDKFCNLVPNPTLHIEVGKFDIKPEEALIVTLDADGKIFCQKKEKKK